MPYILPKCRELFNQEIAELAKYVGGPGDLNYCITKLVWLYFQKKKGGYADINEVVGALECAKLELYRRVASPYEEKKAKENGDVYE